MMTNPLVLAIH